MRYRILCIIAVLLTFPASGYGALFIDAPAEVEQGAAFLVHVQSDKPAKQLTLHWRKKNMHVPLRQDGEMYAGFALLPMPLEGDIALTLTAKTTTATERSLVTPLHVNWVKQELHVEPKYVNPPEAMLAQIQKEQRTNRAVLNQVSPQRYWGKAFIRPVPGIRTSHFGEQRIFNEEPRSRHKGVDLRGATGTPIVAMAAGKVAIAGPQYYSGNVVYIDHGQGVVSLYAHMSELFVEAEQEVEAGQLIGKVGATGRVTGPHLHFAVNILGFPVDPFSLVPEAATGPAPLQK